MPNNFYGEKYHDLILCEGLKEDIKKNKCSAVLNKPFFLKKTRNLGVKDLNRRK
jgi:hypothetical protein